MRTLFLFALITFLTGSPLIALLVIVAIYFFIDYQYVGFSRRLFGRLRRGASIRGLARDVEVNPHDAAARSDLGRLLVDGRRYAAAVPHLERAIERLADSEETVCYLGLAYLGVGRTKEGEELLRRALAKNPRFRYGEPYLHWGRLLLEQDRVQDAIATLERFREIHTSGVEGHYLLGLAYQRAGDAPRAAEMFRGALDLFRRSPAYKRRLERLWALRARLRLLAAR